MNELQKMIVVKVGGNIIDDEKKSGALLQQIKSIESLGELKLVLVHGGGKLATKLAEQLQVPQQMIEGRRITDAETLKIVTMVYAGWINKNIVAQLQALGVSAIGLTGADGNLIRAHKRTGAAHDYGFVGDIDAVNSELLQQLLHAGHAIVVAPITHDSKGQLLNTNADTVAQIIAQCLSTYYEVSLIYSFEKAGVLRDAADEATVIPQINPLVYAKLKAEGAIFAGMIPKLDNAFAALEKGVSKVIIGNALQLSELIAGKKGTLITHG